MDLAKTGMPYKWIVETIHYLGEDATIDQVIHFSRRRLGISRSVRGRGVENFTRTD